MNNLMIIESKGKIDHLKEILPGFEILQTGGHFRKLKSYDLEAETIDYEIDPKKINMMDDILAAAKRAENIYIATDPDREGEAIALQLKNFLPPEDQLKCKRVAFNEISEKEVHRAIDNPLEIDINLANAQQARAIADMIIGFSFTPLARKKLGKDTASVGRIQSVILQTLNNFKDLLPPVEEETTSNGFVLTKKRNAKPKENTYSNDVVLKIAKISQEPTVSPLPNIYDVIIDVYQKTKTPFDEIAFGLQEIYNKGLISYPRTDSRRISQEWINENRKNITYYSSTIVDPQLLDLVDEASKTNLNIQDAHECLRPTEILPPKEKAEAIRFLPKLQKEIYDSILSKVIDAFTPKVKTTIIAKDTNTGDEYTKISLHPVSQNIFKVGKTITSVRKKNIYKKTQAPTDIVEFLIEQEIGRPSTLPSLMEINNSKGNTFINPKNGHLVLTKEGKELSNFVDEHLKDVINPQATSQLEKKLDEISHGKLNGWNFLRELNQIITSKTKEIDLTVPDAEKIEKPKYKNSYYSKFSQYNNSKNQGYKTNYQNNFNKNNNYYSNPSYKKTYKTKKGL